MAEKQIDMIKLLMNAIDPEAVETGDDYHMQKAKKAAARVMDTIMDNCVIRHERIRKNISKAEKDLPAPRLQLVWEKPDWRSDGMWLCWYQLILGVGDTDCRNRGDGTYAITLGGTKVGMNSDSPVDSWTEKLDIPFRDGGHIVWDMKRYGYPGYVIYKGRVEEVELKEEHDNE